MGCRQRHRGGAVDGGGDRHRCRHQRLRRVHALRRELYGGEFRGCGRCRAPSGTGADRRGPAPARQDRAAHGPCGSGARLCQGAVRRRLLGHSGQGHRPARVDAARRQADRRRADVPRRPAKGYRGHHRRAGPAPRGRVPPVPDQGRGRLGRRYRPYPGDGAVAEARREGDGGRQPGMAGRQCPSCGQCHPRPRLYSRAALSQL